MTDRAELEALLDVFRPGWSEEMAPGASGPMAFLTQPRSFVFGAYGNDEPIGWLWGVQIIRPTGRLMSYVHQLDVEVGHRRRGVATSLLEAAISLATRSGSGRLWLTTAASNAGAMALYESAGATSGDQYRNNQGEPTGDVLYSWDLPGNG